MGKLYLLHYHSEWCEKSKASLQLITSDINTLHVAIASEILATNMEYLGETGGQGFVEFKNDLLKGHNILRELKYGYVTEMDETLLSEPLSINKYCAAASEYLAADYHFDPDAFDAARAAEDEDYYDNEHEGDDAEEIDR
jgi:hypothetical protein